MALVTGEMRTREKCYGLSDDKHCGETAGDLETSGDLCLTLCADNRSEDHLPRDFVVNSGKHALSL